MTENLTLSEPEDLIFEGEALIVADLVRRHVISPDKERMLAYIENLQIEVANKSLQLHQAGQMGCSLLDQQAVLQERIRTNALQTEEDMTQLSNEYEALRNTNFDLKQRALQLQTKHIKLDLAFHEHRQQEEEGRAMYSSYDAELGELKDMNDRLKQVNSNLHDEIQEQSLELKAAWRRLGSAEGKTKAADDGRLEELQQRIVVVEDLYEAAVTMLKEEKERHEQLQQASEKNRLQGNSIVKADGGDSKKTGNECDRDLASNDGSKHDFIRTASFQLARLPAMFRELHGRQMRPSSPEMEGDQCVDFAAIAPSSPSLSSGRRRSYTSVDFDNFKKQQPVEPLDFALLGDLIHRKRTTSAMHASMLSPVLEDVRQWSVRKQLLQFLKDPTVVAANVQRAREIYSLDDCTNHPMETNETDIKARHRRRSDADFEEALQSIAILGPVFSARFNIPDHGDCIQRDPIEKLSYHDPKYFASFIRRRSPHKSADIPFTVEIGSWCWAGLTNVAVDDKNILKMVPAGIPSSTKHFLQNNANIIFFMIEIRFETKSFDILRRYSHFLDLLKSLEQDFSHLKAKIPKLPGKDRMRSLQEKLFFRNDLGGGAIIQPPPSSPLGPANVDTRRASSFCSAPCSSVDGSSVESLDKNGDLVGWKDGYLLVWPTVSDGFLPAPIPRTSISTVAEADITWKCSQADLKSPKGTGSPAQAVGSPAQEPRVEFFSNLVLKVSLSSDGINSHGESTGQDTGSDGNGNDLSSSVQKKTDRQGQSRYLEAPSSPSHHDSRTTEFYSERMRSLRTFLSILLSEGIGEDLLAKSPAFREFLGINSGIVLTHIQKQ